MSTGKPASWRQHWAAKANAEPRLQGHHHPSTTLHPASQDWDGTHAASSADWLPGPLVRRLLLVLLLAVLASAALAGWLVARASAQEAAQRLIEQQADEVEQVARLLASKIEQSQKVLASVAEGITPAMLESPASLGWLLQQGLPAARFFDSVQVARKDGQLSINLRSGHFEQASALDPVERDTLLRTLVEGKPLVSELVGSSPQDARILFTQPLVRGEGRTIGAVAGVLRLQSQGLLPQSLAQPARPQSRLLVFTREGVILSHPVLERVLGHVRDEPGLAQAYEQWRSRGQPMNGSQAVIELPGGQMVSLAAVPLPQWMVARVSEQPTAWAGLLRRMGPWVAVAGLGLAGLGLLAMVWLARPLAQLRHQALQLLQTEAAALPAAGAAPWPRSDGEVDDVVRACIRLLEHQRIHQQDTQALTGQLQAVLEHVPLGIAVTRAERVEVVSLQACRLLDYKPAELHGRDLLDLLASAPGEADRMVRHVRAQFAAHGAFDGELPLLRRDGSVQWLRAQGQPVQAGQPQAGIVWVLEDCSALREARQQQDWEGAHDPLTLLPHRAAFKQRLHQLLLARAGRAGTERTEPESAPATGLPGEPGEGVLMFLNLDYFALINDLAGHEAGNDALRHLARLLESELRQMGWAARLGGDEFAVLLPGASMARGQTVAEQLRAAVQAWEPVYGERRFSLGLSIGLVPLPAGLRDVAPLLYAADMACHAAKRAGRNRVEIRRVPQAEVRS